MWLISTSSEPISISMLWLRTNVAAAAGAFVGLGSPITCVRVVSPYVVRTVRLERRNSTHGRRTWKGGKRSSGAE